MKKITSSEPCEEAYQKGLAEGRKLEREEIRKWAWNHKKPFAKNLREENGVVVADEAEDHEGYNQAIYDLLTHL